MAMAVTAAVAADAGTRIRRSREMAATAAVVAVRMGSITIMDICTISVMAATWVDRP